MSVCVRIVLPGTVDTSWVLRRIIDRWSGCTSWKGEGRWFSDMEMKTIVEPVTICETSIPGWTAAGKDWWITFAASVAEEHKQESVFLSVPGRAMLVSADGITKRI